MQNNNIEKKIKKSSMNDPKYVKIFDIPQRGRPKRHSRDFDNQGHALNNKGIHSMNKQGLDNNGFHSYNKGFHYLDNNNSMRMSIKENANIRDNGSIGDKSGIGENIIRRENGSMSEYSNNNIRDNNDIGNNNSIIRDNDSISYNSYNMNGMYTNVKNIFEHNIFEKQEKNNEIDKEKCDSDNENGKKKINDQNLNNLNSPSKDLYEFENSLINKGKNDSFNYEECPKYESVHEVKSKTGSEKMYESMFESFKGYKTNKNYNDNKSYEIEKMFQDGSMKSNFIDPIKWKELQTKREETEQKNYENEVFLKSVRSKQRGGDGTIREIEVRPRTPQKTHFFEKDDKNTFYQENGFINKNYLKEDRRNYYLQNEEGSFKNGFYPKEDRRNYYSQNEEGSFKNGFYQENEKHTDNDLESFLFNINDRKHENSKNNSIEEIFGSSMWTKNKFSPDSEILAKNNKFTPECEGLPFQGSYGSEYLQTPESKYSDNTFNNKMYGNFTDNIYTDSMYSETRYPEGRYGDYIRSPLGPSCSITDSSRINKINCLNEGNLVNENYRMNKINSINKSNFVNDNYYGNHNFTDYDIRNQSYQQYDLNNKLGCLYRQPMNYREQGIFCGLRKKRKTSFSTLHSSAIKNYKSTIPPSRYSSLEYIKGIENTTETQQPITQQQIPRKINLNNSLLGVIIDSDKIPTEDQIDVINSYKNDVASLDLDNITVFQLKALMKEYGLNPLGKKIDLINCVKETVKKALILKEKAEKGNQQNSKNQNKSEVEPEAENIGLESFYF